MADINETINDLARANEEFKSTIDQRLAQLESKGAVDIVTEEKFTALKTDLVSLQAEVTNFQKKSNRIGASENADLAAYDAAYGKWLRKGLGEAELLDLEGKALAVGTGSGADGGVAVPTTIYDQVAQRVVQISPMRQLATVVTANSEQFSFLLNRKGIASGWVAETDTRGATATPQLQKIVPSFGEIYAFPHLRRCRVDVTIVAPHSLHRDSIPQGRR